MFNFSYEKNDIQDIVAAIYKHSEYRDYDLWVLGVAALAVAVSGVAAYFAYRLNKKQSEILEQQNKIALFDKRYEIYYDFRMMLITSGVLLNFIEYISEKQVVDDKENRKMFIAKTLSILFSFTDIGKKVALCEKELQNIVKNFQRVEDSYSISFNIQDVLFFDFGRFTTIDYESHINISLKKEALFSDVLDELFLVIVKINKVSSLFNPNIHDKFNIMCDKLGKLVHAADLYTFKELLSVLNDIANYTVLNNLDSLLKCDIDITP